MEQKYNSRPIEVEDYAILMKWWKSYDGIEIPDSSILPNNGLGGFLIEKEGKMIAAAYLYLTNSAVGYIDFLISDPNYKNKDKYNMIMKLQDACTEELLREGCRIVWAMTSYDHLAEMAGKMGHDVLEDKYSVIYTHQKIYGKLIK